MVRKTQSGKSPNKKRKSDPENSNKHLMFTSYHQQQEETSVHKRNLCIVSFPIIFLFNVLRSLLYQIFVILRFIYFSSSGLFYKKRHQIKDCVLDDNNTCVVEEVVQEMSSSSSSASCRNNSTNNSGPGPGDPLLAKQKHHHRRAFEYISKALKIDEENEGGCEIFLLFKIRVFF